MSIFNLPFEKRNADALIDYTNQNNLFIIVKRYLSRIGRMIGTYSVKTYNGEDGYEVVNIVTDEKLDLNIEKKVKKLLEEAYLDGMYCISNDSKKFLLFSAMFHNVEHKVTNEEFLVRLAYPSDYDSALEAVIKAEEENHTFVDDKSVIEEWKLYPVSPDKGIYRFKDMSDNIFPALEGKHMKRSLSSITIGKRYNILKAISESKLPNVSLRFNRFDVFFKAYNWEQYSIIVNIIDSAEYEMNPDGSYVISQADITDTKGDNRSARVEMGQYMILVL